ncbi:hypothetical protein RB628_31090 [Streptomyces sp. ADMS]|uniref:hypothetical protein n=1 Tax=Streptomyces sp. ADMS TaxID=3071415 RepID=UPI00296ECE3B|nr:hypothetical protein [Streptomyces sp. ADMS]MDW4909668.1 hypothetical protein [Streptomyces sp. ADMS]
MAQRTAIGNRLRCFLHELDPELAVASRGLRRLCIVDHLAQALIQHRGTLAAIAAELVADCRRLSLLELQPYLSQLLRGSEGTHSVEAVVMKSSAAPPPAAPH